MLQSRKGVFFFSIVALHSLLWRPTNLPKMCANSVYRGMSPSEVECCFKQILNGVSYLHSQGVAHRDIKPENLFFDSKGHLKVGLIQLFCQYNSGHTLGW